MHRIDWWTFRLLYPSVYKNIEKKDSYSYDFLRQYCENYGVPITFYNEDGFIFMVGDVYIHSKNIHTGLVYAIDYAINMIEDDLNNKEKRGYNVNVAERTD